MKLVGMKPVIVHGGGPQIGEELKKAGVTSEFINGQRITTKSTMKVVKKVLGNDINKEIIKLLKKHGGHGLSFNHEEFKIIKASKKHIKDVDLGYVGNVSRILKTPLQKALRSDYIPVIAPIGLNRKNDFLNINADSVAGKVAQALKAEKLILLTDVKGIGDSKNDLISKISLRKGQKLLKEDFIKGGMTPKLSAALEAKKNGVKSSHIIDGRVPHAVLLEVLTEEGVGTMIS